MKHRNHTSNSDYSNLWRDAILTIVALFCFVSIKILLGEKFRIAVLLEQLSSDPNLNTFLGLTMYVLFFVALCILAFVAYRFKKPFTENEKTEEVGIIALLLVVFDIDVYFEYFGISTNCSRIYNFSDSKYPDKIVIYKKDYKHDLFYVLKDNNIVI